MHYQRRKAGPSGSNSGENRSKRQRRIYDTDSGSDDDSVAVPQVTPAPLATMNPVDMESLLKAMKPDDLSKRVARLIQLQRRLPKTLRPRPTPLQ